MQRMMHELACSKQQPPLPTQRVAPHAAVPFSWTQSCISLVAYAWLISNYFRVEDASSLEVYRALEPDTYVSFGPYAYLVNTFTRARDNESDAATPGLAVATSTAATVTAVDTVAVWGYKFDTTSIAMRAVAELLHVTAFPDCVHYRGSCISDALTPAVGFAMLDALVDAVRSDVEARATTVLAPATAALVDAIDAPTSPMTPLGSRTQQQRQSRSASYPTVLLSTQYELLDRVHHYLAPTLFSSPLWRTNQAMYYSPERIASATATASASVPDICSAAYTGLRPFFCGDEWTVFSRSCRQSNAKCVAIDRVSTHITTRLDATKRAFANATIDMLIIESTRDVALFRGGLVFLGKRDFDVVTVMRVRACTPSRGCETRVVDDYRYEGSTFTTNANDWHTIATLLRGFAQVYYWLRLLMLFIGCYVAVVGQERDDESEEIKRGVATVVGSSSPTAAAAAEPSSQLPHPLPCSAAASQTPSSQALSSSLHSATYLRLRRCCAALALFFKIPSQVVIYGSLLPVLCHAAAHAIDATVVYDLVSQSFDSVNGLLQLGLWELATVSSLQMRNVWLLATAAHAAVRFATRRNWTPAHGVSGVPQFAIGLLSGLTIVSQFRLSTLRSTRVQRVQRLAKSSRVHPTLEATLGSLYGGGGKSALGGIVTDVKALVCAAAALFVLALSCSAVLKRVRPGSALVFWRSHSPAPLTAGVLWPVSALAVSWCDDLFRVHRANRMLERMHSLRSVVPLDASGVLTTAAAQSSSASQLKPVAGAVATSTPVVAPLSPLVTLATAPLDDRSEVARATLYLMNLAMLSDPTAFLTLRCFQTTTRISVVRSATTQRKYLVPLQYASTLAVDSFTCVRVVRAAELSWSELLECG